MPDRDYLGHGKSRGWVSAIRLLVNEGVRVETVTATTRALAQGLRREMFASQTEEASFLDRVEGILGEKLLGPAKYACLSHLGIDEFDQRSRDLREALEPDIRQMFSQLQRGRPVKAPPRRRLTAEETGSIVIKPLASKATH